METRICRGIRRDLTAYADQALPDWRRDQVAGHLVDCHPCRDELREINRVSSVLYLAARTSDPAPAPGHLADRLVAIAGDEADRELWLAPERDGELPSLRRRRRNRALAGLSMATAGVVGALGGLTLLAPELPVIADLDASGAGFPSLGEAASLASEDDQAGQVNVGELGSSMATPVASSVSIGALAERRLVQRRLDQCPSQVQCPAQVLGLPLVQLAVDTPTGTTVAQTRYGFGRQQVVVVQQHGRLEQARPGEDECTLHWQSGEWVFCMQASSRGAAQVAAQAFPHEEPVTGEGVDERVRLGLQTLTGERGR
ncbi:anti-sigma factor family protein [Luteococcus sp. Sow4_B9]|uniref:anti-sigma factor family protein n=1 Tax=Luteococcus sp. Sow4_B9 TaxID=3438792 RepID=UPI003F9798E6